MLGKQFNFRFFYSLIWEERQKIKIDSHIFLEMLFEATKVKLFGGKSENLLALFVAFHQKNIYFYRILCLRTLRPFSRVEE